MGFARFPAGPPPENPSEEFFRGITTRMTPQEEMEWLALQELEQRKIDEKMWRSGSLRWKLHPAQLVIYDKLRRLPPMIRKRAMECARGFGKTHLEVIMALEDCLRGPHTYPIRIIGPELKQTVEIITPVIEWHTKDAPKGLVRRQKSESKWKVGENWIILGGFNRDYIETLRGQRAKSIYIEECRDVDSDPFLYGMKDVLLPMSLNSLAPVTMLTTTPREMNHSFLKEIVPDARLDGAYFHFTIHDNPLLSNEQRALAIKESGGENTPTFKREYLCIAEKDPDILITPEFEEARHVKTLVVPPYARWCTVIDVGGVRDLTVALLCYYDFRAGKKCVYDERVFRPNTPTDQMVTCILDMEAQVEAVSTAFLGPSESFVRWADAPGQTQVDLHVMHKFPVRIPMKDDWESSINSLKVAIREDKWMIEKRCRLLIETLNNGTFNKNRTDFGRVGELGHMDATAALMYANRVIDTTTNPYPARMFSHQTQFFLPKGEGMESIRNALQPRLFGSFKGKK